MNKTIKQYDDHTVGHTEMTLMQGALVIIWQLAVYLWLVRSPLKLFSSPQGSADPERGVAGSNQAPAANEHTENAVDVQSNAQNRIADDTHSNETSATNARNSVPKTTGRPPLEPPTFIAFLRRVAILGVIMVFFYLCDYKKVLPMTERVYDRDTFLFMVFLLFAVGLGFTLQPTKDILLSREQTEEWKGWMQVMFVWYHYFAAKEWYNWIRVYIAAYVWMTGFGNFSFFWIREDFSVWRVLKMLWRLNFLVVLICGVVSNDYMLYYICAMHTYWFLSVYATMAILPSWNKNRWKMPIKLTVYFCINSLLFDIKGVSDIVFRPLWFILQFHDDRFDIMHEWSFRCGLDHWVCFIGMLCAYNYPYYEALIKYLEKDQTVYKILAKVGIVLISMVVIVLWYTRFMVLEKFLYNAWHPYTSFIPILWYVINRNMWQPLRTHHIYMLAWLGKITLETYLAQLHVYLQSNAKHLIGYISGYHLLTFALATIIYLVISYALFNITVELSNFLIPKDYKKILKNVIYGVLVLVVALLASAIITYTRSFHKL